MSSSGARTMEVLGHRRRCVAGRRVEPGCPSARWHPRTVSREGVMARAHARTRRCGAPGGTRTHGLLLRRQTLYPLSYGRATRLTPGSGAYPRPGVRPIVRVGNRPPAGRSSYRGSQSGSRPRSPHAFGDSPETWAHIERLAAARCARAREGPLRRGALRHCPGEVPGHLAAHGASAALQGHLSRRLHRLP